MTNHNVKFQGRIISLVLVFSLGFTSLLLPSVARAANSTITEPLPSVFNNLGLSYPFEWNGHFFDSVFVAYFGPDTPDVVQSNADRFIQIYFNASEITIDVQNTALGQDPDDYYLTIKDRDPTDYYIQLIGPNNGSGGVNDWNGTPPQVVTGTQPANGHLGYLFDPVFFQYGGKAAESGALGDYPERANSFGIEQFLQDAIEDPIVFDDYSACTTGDLTCYFSGLVTNFLKNLALAIYPSSEFFATYQQKYTLLIDTKFPIYSQTITIFENGFSSLSGTTFNSPTLSLFGHTSDIVDTTLIDGSISVFRGMISMVLYLIAALSAVGSFKRVFGHRQLDLGI